MFFKRNLIGKFIYEIIQRILLFFSFLGNFRENMHTKTLIAESILNRLKNK